MYTYTVDYIQSHTQTSIYTHTYTHTHINNNSKQDLPPLTLTVHLPTPNPPDPGGTPGTHGPAEEATSWAALVLDHAPPVVLTQHQKLDGVGRPHHLLFQHGAMATAQQAVHAVRGHALPVCGHALPVGQREDLAAFGRLHAAAAEREFLGRVGVRRRSRDT